MFAFRLEEEGMLAPDVDPALGPESLVNLGDFGRRRDRVADHAAADVAHDVRDGAVAVDDGGYSWVLCFLGFHGRNPFEG